jgi:hypothetical protein
MENTMANTATERLQLKYEKLVTSIERTWRKREKAEKALARLTKNLAEMERQRVRLARKIERAKLMADEHPKVEARERKIADALVETAAAEVAPTNGGDPGDVPEFLKEAAQERARKLQALPDPKTKEKKAERRKVEAEVRQAELTGKRRKMPPTGKAALDALKAER